MARLLRFGDAEVARSPCADHGHAVCPWNFRQQNASSSVLHSPSSWQRAAKLHSAPHSKQGSISNLSAESLAAATAYELHSESSRPKTPLVPSDLPSTPNAAVRIQRALAPRNLASASGSVMQLPRPSTCRALTAAGSSVPPCSLRNRNSTVFQFPSSSGVSSVDYFVTNEAKDLTRKSERQKQHRAPEQYSCSDKERWAASVQSYKTQRKCDAARFTSNPDSDDPVVQIAAKILDKTESLGSARSDPAMNALQVELKMLQAHRTMELNKLKSASRHPPANLLMRDHNLPESEPSERGQLELSLRNSTFFNRQGYRAVHANQPLVALKHFAAAFNVSKSISHSFRNVFALGSLAASSGDLAKAAQFFGAAINCDERQAIAHFALGSVHFLQENYREALACYDRAIELNGDIKEFFHNRALVRRRLGMYQEATIDYTTPAIMHHRAIERQNFVSSSSQRDEDGPAEAPAKERRIEAAKSSIISQALSTQPQLRTPSQVNIICNSLLSNPFFKMQPSPLQPDIACHLVLLDVPAGEIAISENADACDDVYLIWNGSFSLSRGSIKQAVGEEGAEGAVDDRRQLKTVHSGDCFGDLSHVSPAFKLITGTVGVSQFDKHFLQSGTGQLPLCAWPVTATALEPSQVLVLRVEQYIAMVNRKLRDEEIGRRAFFNNVAQLAEWTPSEVDRLCSSIRMQTLPNRHVLIKQGSIVNGLYFIKRGRCIVRRSLARNAEANANIEASIVQRAAAAADVNGDGEVSAEEVAAALSAARPKSIWKPVVSAVLQSAQRAYYETKIRREAGNEFADYKGDLLGMTERERQEFKSDFESIYKREKDREEERLRRKASGLLDVKQQSFSKTYDRIGAILTVVDAGLDAVAAAVELELQQKGATPGPKTKITSHQHVNTMGDVLKLPSMQQLIASNEDLLQSSSQPQKDKKLCLRHKQAADRSDMQVTLLKPGQWFGAECIIGDGDMPAIFSVETYDPCVEIFFLHADHCFQLYRKHTLGKFLAVYMQWLESLPEVVNADHEWAKTKIALLKQVTYKTRK